MRKLLISLRCGSGHNRSDLAVKDAYLNGVALTLTFIPRCIFSPPFLHYGPQPLLAASSPSVSQTFCSPNADRPGKPGLSVKYPLAYRASTHAAHSSSHIKRSGLSCGEANLRTTPQIPGVSMQQSHATAGLPKPMRTMDYMVVNSSISSPESSLSRSSMISRRSCNLPTPLM